MKGEMEFPHPEHWSDAQLLDRLYCAGTPPGLSEAHLAGCPDCARRWSALEASRARLLEAPPPAFSGDRLRAQRAAVFARMEQPPPRALWALAPATALMLAMGVLLHSPAPRIETQTAAVLTQSDRELLNDIAALVEEDAPRATGAIQGLFDSSAAGEAW